MRCEICNKEIDYELSFKDLFSFKFICKECIKEYKEKETLIPLDSGFLMHYIYYTLNDDISIECDSYLEQKIIDFIQKNKRKMILIYDENDTDFYDFLNFKEDIFLLKKSYFELEKIQEDL